MKKLLVLLLTLALSFSFVACGNGNDNAAEDNNNNAAVENNNDNTDNSDNADKEIAKDIDAVADYLGLKNGKETLYQAIGAKAGKEYNDGKVELYHFDDDSAEYEKLKKGEGDLKIAAHNDGFVLVFTDDAAKDEDMIKKFEAIDFK